MNIPKLIFHEDVVYDSTVLCQWSVKLDVCCWQVQWYCILIQHKTGQYPSKLQHMSCRSVFFYKICMPGCRRLGKLDILWYLPENIRCNRLQPPCNNYCKVYSGLGHSVRTVTEALYTESKVQIKCGTATIELHLL